MPSNKYALIRYRIIDQMIRKRHYPTKEDLRAACEDALYGSSDNLRISGSTIDKDIYALRNEQEFGYAPIEFHPQYRGYFYSDSNYRFTDALSSEEIDLIKISASVLHHFKGSDLLKELESTIERISSKVRLSRKEQEKIDKFIQFETAPVVIGTQFLDPILNAIRNQNKISFSYKKFTGDAVRKHTLRPYLLKEYRNRWYLIGVYSMNQDVLVFALDRITKVDILEDKFERIKNFKPEEVFNHTIGITINTGKPFHVKLAVSPWEGNYIKTQPLHHSQKIISENEKQMVVSIKVSDSFELTSTILALGSGVIVLEPPFLRERIVENLRASLKNYKD